MSTCNLTSALYKNLKEEFEILHKAAANFKKFSKLAQALDNEELATELSMVHKKLNRGLSDHSHLGVLGDTVGDLFFKDQEKMDALLLQRKEYHTTKKKRLKKIIDDSDSDEDSDWNPGDEDEEGEWIELFQDEEEYRKHYDTDDEESDEDEDEDDESEDEDENGESEDEDEESDDEDEEDDQDEDEWVTIESSEINVDGKKIKVFDISLGWTWSEEDL